jgi:uncharacterized RDD family membrane protein YckC
VLAVRSDERLRRLREMALAACAVWLVLENAALLALIPWHVAPQLAVIGATLYKVAFWFGVGLSGLLALALIFGAVWAYSALGMRGDEDVAGREVRRG